MGTPVRASKARMVSILIKSMPRSSRTPKPWRPVQTSDHDAALPEAPHSPDYKPSSAAALPDSANPHNEEALARAQAVDYAALPEQARGTQAQPAQPFVAAPSRAAAAAAVGTTKRQGKNGISKQKGAAAASLPDAPTHFPAGMVRHNPGSLLCVLAALAYLIVRGLASHAIVAAILHLVGHH